MADVKERPILFSGPMVRAILAGRKTQTRRIVRWPSKTHPWEGDISPDGPPCVASKVSGCLVDVPCPYGVPGDRLWVREAFAYSVKDPESFANEERPRRPEHWDVVHREGAHGGDWFNYDGDGNCTMVPPEWKPGIHMPRWACRLVLEVTDVRVQRLQAITEEDAKAEGVTEPEPAHGPWCDPKLGREGHWSYRKAFASLWESINGKRAPWSSNPFVWAISFRRI